MTSESMLRDRFVGAEPVDDWPEPLPLRDELLPVQPFIVNLLPSEIRAWVVDISERMNIPLDLAAIPAMVSLSALVGRRVGIRPQQNTTWLEAANLWGAVIARPGSLKTPASSEALSPIRRIEMRAAEEHVFEIDSYKVNERLFKIRESLTRDQVKELLHKGSSAGADSAAANLLANLKEPELPQARRYMTTDATVEKLGEICAANPNGVLVYRDEIMSLLSDLDNPDKASARGFMLTGWSGLEGYTYDRILRGTIRIAAVNIALFGTTQPNRIARYIRESLHRFDDGMAQRIQLLVWPDIDRKFREMDRLPDADARRRAYQCYDRLAAFDPAAVGAQLDEFDGPDAVPYLRFALDAQAAFSAWRSGLEHRLNDPDLQSHFAAHLAKYRGLLPRLALICHLASGGTGPVSIAAFRMAEGWIRYLESHAQRVYASTEVDNAEAARAIWRRIKKGDLSAPFTSRDIQRKGWSMLKDNARIGGGLEALVVAEWLRATKEETGGRPSTIYMPNPKTAGL